VGAFFRGAAGLFGLHRAGLLPGRGARIDSTTISSSFADIAELATEEYNFTNVGKYVEDGSEILGIGVPLTGGSFLITYSGTVKAGIADVAQAGENRMRVSIGSENNDDALVEASVVTTTYGPGTGEAVAHLGVIGPTRMDYPATMTAVRAVARYLSRFLSPPET